MSTCGGTIPTGTNLATANPGSFSITVDLSDNVGNISALSVAYTVSYNICPLYDSTLAVKTGSSYPIKIELRDAAAQSLSDSGIVVQALGGTLAGTDTPGVLHATGNSNPGFAFRYDSILSGYIFNLDTAGNPPGTYSLNFVAGSDPSVHSALSKIN